MVNTIGRNAVRGLVIFLFFMLVTSLLYSERGYLVSLRMSTTAGPMGEVYFAADGEGYSPERRAPFTAISDGRWHDYEILLPTSKAPASIRIDPGTESGRVGISGFQLIEPGGGHTELGPKELRQSVRGTHQADLDPSDGDALWLNAVADDPFVDLAAPRVHARNVWVHRIAFCLLATLAAMGLMVLLGPLWRRVRATSIEGTRTVRILDRVGRALDEPALLVVDRAAVAILATMLVVSTIYIGMGLHQSSIGAWEEFYPPHAVEQTVDIGDARRVRSDEWNTQTPWVLNQVQRGARAENASIGGERAPLIAAVPVLDPVASLQPKFLGFALFDLDRGYSWWWAYKTIGLVAAFFWLLLLLTRGNTVFAILGSLWIYASSFTQWWLSSNLSEILIAFALVTIGAHYLLFASRRGWMVAGGGLVAYATVNLLLHLYPPFILPLAYLGVFILAGSCLATDAAKRIAVDLRFRAGVAAAAAALAIGLVALFFIETRSTIEAMMATVYPGHRVAMPGALGLPRVMYAWFEAFRFGESLYPAGTGNASEASSFIILAPIALLAYRFRALLRRDNAMVAVLAVYLLLVLAWICLPLPSAVRSVAQIMGWSWSPPERSLLGLGLGSIILSTIVAAAVSTGGSDFRPPMERRWFPFFAAACVAVFGWGLRQVDPTFVSKTVIVAGVLTAFALTYGVVMGRRGMFAIAIAVLLVPGLSVNPLTSGLSAIMDKPILVAARKAGSGPDDRWAVVGDFIFAQGLKAQGLDVFNGSQLVPDRRSMKVLDPTEAHADVWNRYAHVVLMSAPGQGQPVFQLKQPDVYTIELDICGQQLRALGVTHVAYVGRTPDKDRHCLTPVLEGDGSGVGLYRLGNSPSPERNTTR